MLDDVENLLDQAIAAHENSNFKTAFHLYREILTEDQNQPDAFRNPPRAPSPPASHQRYSIRVLRCIAQDTARAQQPI